jgi:hypothetical protein
MKKQISSFLTDLRSGKKLSTLDEASTKQAIVLRLLSILGWDIFDVDEVYPDYPVNSTMISYALRVDKEIQLLIDVKGNQEKLDAHQKNFTAIAAQAGVDVGVLTNGATWWFFLATDREKSRFKRFFNCDFQEQKPDAIVEKLVEFMGRAKVARGDAVKSAKAAFHSQRQEIAANALPEAWNQLLSPPNKILMEILSEITEKLCGYRADASLVEKFIKNHLSIWQLDIPANAKTIDLPGFDATVKTPLPSENKKNEKALPERLRSYAGKRIKSYRFNGLQQDVRNWEEMLLSLCEFFAGSHLQDFEKVLWITDHQRVYFSTNSDELRIPEKIKKTNIYVETKLKPDEIVKIADDLMVEFGYDAKQLEININ